MIRQHEAHSVNFKVLAPIPEVQSLVKLLLYLCFVFRAKGWLFQARVNQPEVN